MTKHQWREMISNALLLGMGTIWLIIFFIIIDQGYARLVEHNPWILWFELGSSLLMIGLAIERTFDDIDRFWPRRK
ncbi:hypothetical protein LCGC14_0861550 [marine sediment metagenome]|uniref:Cation-transporting P-type ATPase C-terminal domain-containing protein n=1 Tax=marine sediment metagenome TaxID=412755 RepID=A0A0F9RRW8_9ZZZZ